MNVRLRPIALLILGLALLTAPAGAGAPPPVVRLDPTLRYLLREQPTAELAAPRAQQEAAVEVTIRAVRDVSPAVEALGGQVRTVVGGGPVVMTARLPLGRLESLARVRGVIAISASQPARPALDRSVADIRANAVWALRHHGLPIKGQGVLVGIVDTGIDWQHPDFWDTQGRSRIVALWDQTASGSPPVGWDYGVEWQRWQIEAGLVTQTDENGHGSHMAGIAAGSGQADARYTGVAPEAELIVVKSPLDTTRIIDAWRYIVDTARRLGRPVVINNSFGSHFGAHDGTGDLEVALNALAGPGVLFVVAAGNEGESAIHAAGRVLPGGEVTVNFAFAESYPHPYADVNLWYDGADRFSVSVRAPTGQTFGPVTPGGLGIYTASNGTDITIDAVAAPWPVNGDNWVRIRLDGAGGQPLRGGWSFTLHGDRVSDGRFDAWLSYWPWDRAYFLDHVEPYGTLREPGTAAEAVTVGSYVTKRCWSAMDGNEYCDPYLENALFPPSSRGPTRDGRLKPEVAAPGVRVFASRSATAPLTELWRVVPGGRYEGRIGTSVSTAHITGVLALMLQVYPTLDPATAQAILRATARTDVFTGPTWSPAWGAGKVDALAAVQAVQRYVANRQYLPLVIHAYRRLVTPTPVHTPIPSRTPTPTATPHLIPSPGSPTPLSLGPEIGTPTPVAGRGAREQ